LLQVIFLDIRGRIDTAAMRIKGYLVAGLLGVLGGWLLFSPEEEAPVPVPDPVESRIPPRPVSPLPAPVRPWTDQAAPRYLQPMPGQADPFRFRPLNEREQQRFKAEVPYREAPYRSEQPGYQPPYSQPQWTNPGYDFRPVEPR